MNLRLKVFLSIGSILVTLSFMMYLVISSIFLKNFQTLETTSIEKDVQRISNAFDNRMTDLAIKIADWGQWDDTYDFAQTKNPDYIESNLQDSALEVLQIEYLVITDTQGKILYKKQINKDGESIPFSQDLEQYIQYHPKLTQHAESNSLHTGIISLPEGTLVTAARAITSSDGQSPVAGTIFFAFSLSDKETQKLAELTQQNIKIQTYSESIQQSDFLSIDERLTDNHPIFIQPPTKKDTLVYGYTFKKNLENKKAVIIQLEAKRELYQKGKEAIFIFTLFMLEVSLLMLFAVLYLFEKLVLKRLFRLEKAVRAVSQRNQNDQASIFLPGKDEFSSLAKQINTMLATLYTLELNKEESQKNFLAVLERKNSELSQKVTETEQAKETIRKEKERAESILQFLESIHEAVYVTDTERKIIFVNPAAITMIGKNREAIIGTHTTEHFSFIIKKGDVTEKDFPVKHALSSMQPLTFPDDTFIVRDKKYTPVIGTAAPIFDKNKQLTGAIIVFQDISEKYDLEQMKEGFLSIAAHQLRTPLGSMRWSMELLLSGDFGKITKETKEMIAQLYSNTQRMLTLVNDLLDVSRIDQKRNFDEKKSLNLNSLFQTVIKALAGEAGKRSVQVRLKTQDDLLTIVAPEKHLYEAFENLIANAIKYNKENGQVDISITQESHGIHIEITDTGIGIPEAAQQKMFSRFFRASNAILKETEGSGLGLFVVKSYLEEAGASIRFESTENVGTTFFIDFPNPFPQDS